MLKDESETEIQQYNRKVDRMKLRTVFCRPRTLWTFINFSRLHDLSHGWLIEIHSVHTTSSIVIWMDIEYWMLSHFLFPRYSCINLAVIWMNSLIFILMKTDGKYLYQRKHCFQGFVWYHLCYNFAISSPPNNLQMALPAWHCDCVCVVLDLSVCLHACVYSTFLFISRSDTYMSTNTLTCDWRAAQHWHNSTW